MPTLKQSVGRTQTVAKGLFLDYPRGEVPEGGCSDGRNVEPDVGTMRRTPGHAKYSATAVPGTGPVMQIQEFVTTAGVRSLMAVTRTRAAKYNIATNVFDDITGGAELLTGGTNNPIFSAALNDLWIVTNGVNTLKKWNGTTWAALGGSPPAKAVGLDIYEGHVLLWNVEDIGYRVQWSDLNNPEGWTIGAGSDAGILDIREGNLLPILAGGKMRRQFLFYKDQFGGVYAMSYVGGDLVMQVEEVVPRFGVFSPRGVAVFGDIHFVMASDEQIYALTPGSQPEPIGDPIRRRLFGKMNWNARHAAWVGVDSLRKLIIFAVPEGTATTCTQAYLFNYLTGAWGVQDFPAMCGAVIRDPETRTINELTGTIDELSGTIDSLSEEGKDVFLWGGVGESAFVNASGRSNTADGAEIDGWLVGRWAWSGDGRMIRARGIEAEVANSPAVEIGTAATIDGTMSFTPLGTLNRGKVDANLSAEYLAPRFRSMPGGGQWEVQTYRLDGYPRGRR